MSMSDGQLRTEIEERFLGIADDDKLVHECMNICRNYAISPEELFFRWEAMSYRSRQDALSSTRILSFNDAIALKESILQEQAMKKAKEQKARASLNSMFARPRVDGNLRSSKSAQSTTASSSVKPSFRVSFKGTSEEPSAKKARKYRYMFEKVAERSEVLDDRIDGFKEVLRDAYGIEEFGVPTTVTEEDVILVGRICGEADSTSAPTPKLVEGSIYLESSRMDSGDRTLLKFDSQLKLRGVVHGTDSLGIFPGAIVGVKGRNGGGGWFAVNEVYSFPALQQREGDRSNVHPFSICAMSGPYTSDADLQYKHLETTLERVKTHHPDVLLLLGPFVDTSHPLIKTGDVDYTPKEMFELHFVERLRSLLASQPDLMILLVPSVKDILSDHAVLPQSELERDLLPDPRVKFLPNPCRFTLNDVSFGVTSVDVLFHLRSQEFVLKGEETEPRTTGGANDVMANTCRHILQQRSFYPLFPVPQNLSHEVNLDVSHSDALGVDTIEEKNAPDVIIIPSRLKHFSKSIESTLMVNPSVVTKGIYARITVDSDRNATCEISSS